MKSSWLGGQALLRCSKKRTSLGWPILGQQPPPQTLGQSPGAVAPSPHEATGLVLVPCKHPGLICTLAPHQAKNIQLHVC